MNEIIIAMRVIKMYAWEKPFSEVIDKIRRFVSNSRLQYKYLIPCSLYIQLNILSLRLEVKVLRKRSYLRGVYLSIYSSASKVVPFLTFLAFVLSGNQLNAQNVFFLVSCSNTIIQSMTYILPSAISGLGEILVSISRIEVYATDCDNNHNCCVFNI
jgi:ATP-binding cassette subfamily C (CFTR/MRP) protein 4